MAPSATSTKSLSTRGNTSDEHKQLSQKGLDDPNKTLHGHLTASVHPTHMHDIWGGSVMDYPYTSTNHGADFEPGIAVATSAATVARPNGTTENGWNEKNKHMTVSFGATPC